MEPQHPRINAQNNPEKTALVFSGSGITISYADLERNINRCAQFFYSVGLRPGDTVAVSMGNRPELIELCWAALNSGLYFVPISHLLEKQTIAYLIDNSDAKVFICDEKIDDEAIDVVIKQTNLTHTYSTESSTRYRLNFHEILSELPTVPIEQEMRGEIMLYSSGTTGKPKGIKVVSAQGSIFEPHRVQASLIKLYCFDQATRYLSTQPLYHSAALKFVLAVTIAGGTCVVMERFEALSSLELIDNYSITHSQWVPTMFVRLLRLPREQRNSFKLDSHKYAIHGSAPCPIEIKKQLLDWWGDVVYEYYSGTEGVGFCAIDSLEWRSHSGSVGKAVRGRLYILGDDGQELPANNVGNIYFSRGGESFIYYKDEDKTKQATHEKGWQTFGDIGYVDEQGYLYLSDRRDNLIISGGVNIYPQEIEDLLIAHNKVYDAAVIGLPCPEFGQRVEAVVIPETVEGNDSLEEELRQYCKDNLATFKCPQKISFSASLPRQPNGKLIKRLLVERYSSSQNQ